TPSIGAIYALTPDASVYASWGRGFETPTANELSYSGPAGSFGFDLEAATSSQAEVGLKQRFGPGLQVNAALFRIETKDEIVVAS
ncbi:TonB-dependent receptor, partial [Acinetobacter baumannii]